MPMESAQRRQASSFESRWVSMIAWRWARVPAPWVLPVSSSSVAKSKLGRALTNSRNCLFSGFVGTAGTICFEHLGDLDLFKFFHGETRRIALESHLAQELRQ